MASMTIPCGTTFVFNVSDVQKAEQKSLESARSNELIQDADKAVKEMLAKRKKIV